MSEHDPYPTADDADEDKFVLKLQRPLGAPLTGDQLDIRISPGEADQFKQALVDKGFHVSDVIELSVGETLQVIGTSLVTAGGLGGLAHIIVEFLRKDRGKEYRLYVNDKLIELKGLSVRQARQMLAEQTQAALGWQSTTGEDQLDDEAGDDELLG